LVRKSIGGVGRNLAETVWRLGVPVTFVTALGNDAEAHWLLKNDLSKMGLDFSGIEHIASEATATYNAVHDPNGQLLAAVADMGVFDKMNPQWVENQIRSYHPSIVAFDGNMSSEVMKYIARVCQELNIPAFFEPTSVLKSLKLFEHPNTIFAGSVRYASPNEYELEAMSNEAGKQFSTGRDVNETYNRSSVNWNELPLYTHRFIPHAFHLANYIPNLFVKFGEYGSLLVRKSAERTSEPKYRYLKPKAIQVGEIVSVTGAGDSFVGTLLASLHVHHSFVEDDDIMCRIICNAQRAAVLTLKSDKAVSSEIKPFLLAI